MNRFFITYIVLFPIVLVGNQAFYNFTFKSYALAAAFPKVAIVTGIISLFACLFVGSKTERESTVVKNVTPTNPQISEKATTYSETPTVVTGETKCSLKELDRLLVKGDLTAEEYLLLRDKRTKGSH